MTYLEIDKAIADIAKQQCAECKTRLDAIPIENSTERKAVQLEYGMYSFCSNAGLLSSPTREGCLKTRYLVLSRQIRRYPKLNEIFSNLSEEEKMRFVAALQAELFIRDQWLGTQYAELNEAESSGDAKKAFEFKIKIGAVKDMFSAWETWRVKNNIFPHMFEEETV